MRDIATEEVQRLIEWTIIRLVVSETKAAVTTAKWALQGRASQAHIQPVELNAEKKIDPAPKGSTFLSRMLRNSRG
jgi:hypothetical protein